MMPQRIAVFVLGILALVESSRGAVVLDVAQFNTDETLAAAAMQGLANRTGPQVLLFCGDRNQFTTFKSKHVRHAGEVLRKYRSVDDVWREYYATQHHLAFTNVAGMAALLNLVRSQVAGTVLYHPTNAGERCVALTLAGLSNAVPVTADLLRKHPDLKAMPVLTDLRGRFADSLTAQRWAISELLPHCSRDEAYSYGGAMDMFAVDIAVARRMFVYQLSHLSPEVVPTDEHRARYEKLPFGLKPPDRELLPRIYAHLKPLSPVWGWGEPDEATFLFKVSQGGAFVLCAQVPNISFHAGIKPLNPQFRQEHLRPDAVKVEPKHYIAFMVNEGDTMKCAGSLMSYGMWLEPERGKLPINWGVSSYLCEKFPGMMEYYYRSRTTNDYFFAGPGGYGYVAPKFLPEPLLFPFAAKVREGNRIADTRIAEFWYFYPLQPEALRTRWLAAMELDGLTQWKSPSRITFPQDGPPIIDSPHYYNRDSTEEFAQALIEEAKTAPRPWFTVVYGGDPRRFAELAHRLPAERFKFVRLDELFIAAQTSRKTVEGKVLPARKTQ